MCVFCSSLLLQPKAYTVNHATAFGGRDTVKVLMALLDEEALAPPCRNKAELLSEDQPVLNGAEGTSVLMLFRLVQKKLFLNFEPLPSVFISFQNKCMKKIHQTGLCLANCTAAKLYIVLFFCETSAVAYI